MSRIRPLSYVFMTSSCEQRQKRQRYIFVPRSLRLCRRDVFSWPEAAIDLPTGPITGSNRTDMRRRGR